MSSSSASADDSVIDNVSITIPSACTLSGTGMNTHTATINPGTYMPDIGTTTLKAFCNDNEGFAIFAAGYTGNIVGETNSNKLVGTSYTTETIPTGIGTSGTSQWAMKLTTNSSATYPIIIDSAPNTSGGTDASFSSYHVVPNEYTKVAHRNSNTDVGTSAIGSELTTTYAVNISSAQIADTYTGKVIYTMVHPATEVPLQPYSTEAGKIGYYPNARGVIDTMGDQEYTGYTSTVSDFTTPLSNGGEATLWASNFKRDNYGFVGWTDKYDWVLNENDANGNGTGANLGYHIYGPNATITLPSDIETKGLSLYAVWAPSVGNLQNYTCPDNTTMPIGQVTALKDLRDNDTYAVAKLADGECWMIENLRLDYDATIGSANEALSQGYFKSATYGDFSGLAEPENENFSATTPVVANSRYTSDGTGSIYDISTSPVTLTDIGTGNIPGRRMPRYNNDNTNSNSAINPNVTTSNMTTPEANIYSYGNYYSQAAAAANTTDAYDGSANASICPSGWRLPDAASKSDIENGNNNDFLTLSVAIVGAVPSNYSSTTGVVTYVGDPEGINASKIFRSYPNNFIYSSYKSGSSNNSKGSFGFYCSSVRGYAFSVSYGTQVSVVPATSIGNNPAHGRTIRCIISRSSE